MHPAHQAFRNWWEGKQRARIGQLVVRAETRFEIRNHLDESVPADSLRTYTDPFAARELALYTDTGKFRPLKSALNLRRGWRMAELDFAGLVTALDCFYPAALAHWHAARAGRLETTSYRSFAARQTGMYRVTARLDVGQIQRVAACCCHGTECLKQPKWAIDESTPLRIPPRPEPEGCHLPIPCPEPCSLLLSLARMAARLDQEELMNVQLTKSDLALIGQVLRGVLEENASGYREGDFHDPRHRQRIRHFLEKHAALFPVAESRRENQED